MDATLRQPEVDKYIGTGENLGISDKLAFLSCYGDLFIAIIGRKGEGKSLIAQGLISELKGIPTALVDEYLEPDRLLVHLGRCFGLQGDGRSRPPGLGELNDYVTALTQQGKKPVLIVDDAGKLKDKMLRAILTIAERCSFGLVLFGTAGLTRMRSFKSFSPRIYTCHLEKMTDDDLRSYIRRRHEYDLQVSESQLDNILRQSAGAPDKVDRLVDELLESSPSNRGLPLIHISVVAVLALILVSAWLFDQGSDRVFSAGKLIQEHAASAGFSAVRVGSSPFDQDSSTSKTVKQGSPETAAKAKRPVRMVTTPVQTPMPAEILPEAVRNEDQGSKLVRNDTGSTKPGGTDIEGIIEESDTSDRKVNQKRNEGVRTENPLGPEKTVRITRSESNIKQPLPQNRLVTQTGLATQVSDRVVAAVNGQGFSQAPSLGLRQKNWLVEARDSEYTLQLMGSHSEDRIQEFIQAQGVGNFAYFETKLRDQSWYVLTVGQYQNREDALQAIHLLPPDLQAQKPWARNVASIRAVLQ